MRDQHNLHATGWSNVSCSEKDTACERFLLKTENHGGETSDSDTARMPLSIS